MELGAKSLQAALPERLRTGGVEERVRWLVSSKVWCFLHWGLVLVVEAA